MKKIILNTLVEPIEMTCENCRSIFSFNFEDIERRESETFMGFKNVNRFVVCPVCKSNNELTKIKIDRGEEDENNSGC